jgi:alkylhydroperoxidase family enzyme
MSGLERVAWESRVLEPRRDPALEAELRKSGGFVAPMVAYLSDCPWLARATGLLNEFSLGLRQLSPEVIDLIGLVVSQDSSCRYCYATQRLLMRAQGYSERRIRALEGSFFAAQREPRERAALEYARRVSRCEPRPGAADRAALRAAGWSDDAIRELALTASFNVFLNRVATLLALPVERLERMSRHWVVSLLSPVAALRIRALRARALRLPVPPAPRDGSWSGLVRALDGLRAAAVLGDLLEVAIASPLLPARAKGLAFAAIARGLGCPHGERAALALLEASGFARERAERTLANLGAPELDPVEAAVLPFARETIRYEPARIQRHARELATALPRGAFVELVGVTSLANMVCRLWLALEAP